jgi:hypothetical protein
VYVGRSGGTIGPRCKEINRHSLYHPKKVVVAEHSVKRSHYFSFCGTSILDRISGQDCLVKEGNGI